MVRVSATRPVFCTRHSTGRYRHDVHDVIQHIDNPKLFKAGVKQLYHSHCEAGSTANDMDRCVGA